MSETLVAEKIGSDTAAYHNPDNTKFSKGNPGKPKGALSKRTLMQRDLLRLLADGWSEKEKPEGACGPLPPRVERLRLLLTSDNESIAAETERALMSYDMSKPKLTLEVEGTININALILAAFARARPSNGNGNGTSRTR
jgi:hypothetical protein